MQKWSIFATGVMAGIIVVLVVTLLAQQNENLAYAGMMKQDVGGATGTFMQSGGTGQQLNDVVWILYRRPGQPAEDGDTTDKVTGDYKLSLAAYRIGQGSKAKMELLAVRDISWDIEIPEYNSIPAVRTIKKELEDASKKKKKK